MTALRCQFGLHAPMTPIVENQGRCFSRCRRCGADLVETVSGRWRPPGDGYRVVWRPRGGGSTVTKPLRPVRAEPADDFMTAGGDDFEWERALGGGSGEPRDDALASVAARRAPWF